MTVGVLFSGGNLGLRTRVLVLSTEEAGAPVAAPAVEGATMIVGDMTDGGGVGLGGGLQGAMV